MRIGNISLHPVSYGCFLVRTGGGLVHIEAGLGPDMPQLPHGMHLVGSQLLTGLRALSVTAAAHYCPEMPLPAPSSSTSRPGTPSVTSIPSRRPHPRTPVARTGR